jgi:hypothetical protein
MAPFKALGALFAKWSNLNTKNAGNTAVNVKSRATRIAVSASFPHC